MEAYAPYKTRTRNCLVCYGTKTDIWAQYGSYTAVRCPSCGFIWINPFLNDEGLQHYYQDYIGMRSLDQTKTRQRAVQYQLDSRFLELFVSSGKVLDIGCSGGDFLATLNGSFQKYGVEIDSTAVASAKARYPFDIRCGKVEEMEFETTFDAVIMRGLIEHLADPELVIAKVASLLNSNGILFIAATPDVSSFCADLYRERWNQFHPIRHLSYFSLHTLTVFLLAWKFEYIAHQHPYLETPYADIRKDYMAVEKACVASARGDFYKIGRSRAFWGNMMNVVYRKC